jgi:NAD+ synthase
MRYPRINPRLATKRLTEFIEKSTRLKGFSKLVLGLSGGLDSTVVAYLGKKALGKDGIVGIIMPYGKLSKRSTGHAKKVANALKIRTECIDISDMIDAYFKKNSTADKLRRGNKMARERMSVLYDKSQQYNALVIGTSNRTETLLGYGTIYGDCACAINPIGRLYKTQVRALAEYLKVPSYILSKPPSADLWHGQSDEQEIGYKYSDIDRLLYFMIDRKSSYAGLIKQGFNREFIQDIKTRIRKNRFKSQLPLVARL